MIKLNLYISDAHGKINILNSVAASIIIMWSVLRFITTIFMCCCSQMFGPAPLPNDFIATMTLPLPPNFWWWHSNTYLSFLCAYVQTNFFKSWDCTVHIVTRLLAERSGTKIPAKTIVFFSVKNIHNGYDSAIQWVLGFLPGGKVATAWSRPLTSIWCWGQEYMELYLYSPYMSSWWWQEQLYLFHLYQPLYHYLRGSCVFLIMASVCHPINEYY